MADDLPRLSLIRDFRRGNERRRILSALAFASKVHARHVRDNGDPYIIHPYRTAMLLIREFRIRDADIIIGALLHDVLEMSRLGEKRIVRRFGKRVARMVRLVTKPRRRGSAGWEERYYSRIRRAGGEAQIVKFADRLDNLRDLPNAPKAKQMRYLRATKDRFLPWMKETDMRFYRKLRNEIRKFR